MCKWKSRYRSWIRFSLLEYNIWGWLFPRGKKGDIASKALGRNFCCKYIRSVGLWVYKFLLLEEVQALITFGVFRAAVCLQQVWVQGVQSQPQLSPSGAAGLWGLSESHGLFSPQGTRWFLVQGAGWFLTWNAHPFQESCWEGQLSSCGKEKISIWKVKRSFHTVKGSACTRPPLTINPAPLIRMRNAIW